MSAYQSIHPLVRPFIRLSFCSFIYSSVTLCIHPFNCPLIRLLVCLFTHSLVCPILHLLICLSVHSFTCPSINSFINLSIQPSIHSHSGWVFLVNGNQAYKHEGRLTTVFYVSSQGVTHFKVCFTLCFSRLSASSHNQIKKTECMAYFRLQALMHCQHLKSSNVSNFPLFICVQVTWQQSEQKPSLQLLIVKHSLQEQTPDVEES